MTSKCKRYCSVPQCSNYKSNTISIHKFPKDPVLSKKWAVALRIGKPITKGMSVCSEHFLPNDFYPLRAYSTKRYVKSGVVPSQKIPVRKHDQPKPSNSSSSRISRAHKKIIDRELRTDDDGNTMEVEVDYTNQDPGEKSSDEDLMLLDTYTKVEKTIQFDKSVQVNILSSGEDIRFHEYILDSATKLNVYTGINLDIYNTIVKLVTNTIKLFPSLNLDNIDKKICLVFTKLKLGLSFRALAILYTISYTTAQNYFHDYIQVLYFALKCALHFPTREENLMNLPKCFAKYRKVRIILDATEIPIQKSNCLDCRIRTYSHYKKTHTAKFLIGVAPAGIITYVSSAYGGHVSDKAIFNNEKIIDLLDPYHDEIMVDKGILIDKECAEVGIKLIRPPFLRKKSQFSKEEALQTASIARARVHVERAIQRIKVFNIFSNKLEWTLVPYLNEMMTIVCASVNLSKPILNDDKFFH